MPTQVYPVQFSSDTAQFILDMKRQTKEAISWLDTLADIVGLPEALGTWS